MRKAILPLLLSSIFLGGCAASLAASAIGAAVQASQSRDQSSNEHLMKPAAEACRARASAHGTVNIIDVERRSTSRIIVYGTVGEGQDRRAFDCSFRNDGTIADFNLRTIRAK